MVGVGAFTAKGSAIPLVQLDAILGGENYVNLIQNMLAVIAFWMLYRTVKGLEVGVFGWGNPLLLAGALLSFSIPFLLIPGRHGTSVDFIDEFSPHWALGLYGSVYMGWVVALTLATYIAVKVRRARLYYLVRIGCLSVAFGSASEILYLVSRASGRPSEGISEVLRQAFEPLFYGGVMLIAIGMAGFWVSRVVRRAAFATTRWAMNRSHPTSEWPAPRVGCDIGAMNAYRAAVALLDEQGDEPGGVRGTALRLIASRALDNHIGAPPVLTMVCTPGAPR